MINIVNLPWYLDCIKQFLRHIQNEAMIITEILNDVNEPLKWNEWDQKIFKTAKRCKVWNIFFHSIYNLRYRDHEHLGTNTSSNVRFILCNKCYLSYGAMNYRIHVVDHNGTSYDHHHIITNLNESMRISVVAKNTERLFLWY